MAVRATGENVANGPNSLLSNLPWSVESTLDKLGHKSIRLKVLKQCSDLIWGAGSDIGKNPAGIFLDGFLWV
jgi:hypothetical protein